MKTVLCLMWPSRRFTASSSPLGQERHSNHHHHHLSDRSQVPSTPELPHPGLPYSFQGYSIQQQRDFCLIGLYFYTIVCGLCGLHRTSALGELYSGKTPWYWQQPDRLNLTQRLGWLLPWHGNKTCQWSTDSTTQASRPTKDKTVKIEKDLRRTFRNNFNGSSRISRVYFNDPSDPQNN